MIKELTLQDEELIEKLEKAFEEHYYESLDQELKTYKEKHK